MTVQEDSFTSTNMDPLSTPHTSVPLILPAQFYGYSHPLQHPLFHYSPSSAGLNALLLPNGAVWCPGALHHEIRYFPILLHCAVSSTTLAPCNASICRTLSLTVDWLIFNHHACPSMDSLYFPLFHLFHINSRPPYHPCSPPSTWTAGYAIYLPMWTPPSTPCTVTATAHPAVPPPPYSLSSGPPGSYRITQVIIPIIWILVLQS